MLADALAATEACAATHDTPPAPTSPRAWNVEIVSPASVVIGPLRAIVWLMAFPMSFENCW